ncbi:sperm flagellar protein 1 [Strigomonas culicis]|uniref:Sperm flagellar protein 1 n=2 Tax=Strigomonas culicis TaxID=28005 RepID=S9VF57_9TRYP|nr:sperm flagellar protein 1 [Strigomonas culicis]|eukprot:EPY25661.1 sperm flagellar protein 1 [Strigomonas culicis]
MSVVPFSEEDLHELYLWVDDIPISRPKRNIARDFSDGCCVAEILKFFFPKLVDLHNYVPAGSLGKKKDNWHLLNQKVFSKLYFIVPEEEVEDIVTAVPGAIERFLRALRIKITQIKNKKEELGSVAMSYRPSSTRDANARAGDAQHGEEEEEEDLKFYRDAVQRRQQENARSKAAANRPGSQRPTSDRAPAPQDDAERDVLVVKELINEKDKTILELRETVSILTEKIMKLEELIQVKDEKLNQYRNKFGRV